jgi:small conductance mechanosensitive channel
MMMMRFIKAFASIFLVIVLILSITLGWQSSTVAQMLPSLGWSEGDIKIESYIPTFYRGDKEIAPVFLDGKMVGIVDAFVQFKENNDRDDNFSAAIRSHVIHSKLQKILDNITLYAREVLPERGITELEAQAKEISQQLVTTTSQKNGSMAVLVTFPQNDFPEIVYTVTQADIEKPRLGGGSQPEKIAQRSATKIKDVLIQSWKERQQPHLQAQAQRGLIILLGLIFTSVCLGLWQKQIATKKSNLSEMLSQSILKKLDIKDNHPQEIGLLSKQRLSLRQNYSLLSLYNSALFWTQWLIWVLGFGYLTSLVYWSRPFSNWILGVSIREVYSAADKNITWPPLDWLITLGKEATLGTPLLILFLFVIARLTLKVGDAISDSLAHYWTERTSNQRYALRAPTLSKAFKGWFRAVIYFSLGLILVYHLHKLGAITQLLAFFFGFLSFAISLASQNVLKDLIGGLLILWEDQYAVGDVIVVGDQGGLVEAITLRVTKLRNLDGELITIPNGSIGMVRNLSSEWSRVNYAIEVGYDADVERVLEVMQDVATQLYQDSQWQEQILETPEILGIDNIAHTGILIRLIIKTQPLQQWAVAREFRLRLKKAFDQEGIEVGIPQQMMLMNNSLFTNSKETFPNNN